MVIGGIKLWILYNLSITPGQIVLSLKCPESIARLSPVQPWDKWQLSSFVKQTVSITPIALGLEKRTHK